MLRPVRCNILRYPISPCHYGSSHFVTGSPSTSLVVEDESRQVTEIDDDDAPGRDISKLSKYHKMKLHGQPIPTDMFKWQKEPWAVKQRFGEHGEASGVDPGLLWPSKSQMEEQTAVDSVFQPDFFKTREKVLQEKEELEARYKQQEQAVLSNLKTYPKMLQDYKAKMREQQLELKESEDRKEAKVKEIQEYFGYAVDPSDPRFQAMMEKKVMEERKLAAAARRQEKKNKMIAQIAASTTAIQEDQKKE